MNIPEMTPPNGQPYRTTETRIGMPLSYVSEKLRAALMGLHSAHAQILEHVPEGLPCPEAFLKDYPQYDPKNELRITCREGFRHGVISYLALNNLLALSHEDDLCKRLVTMPFSTFCRWLDYIEKEGSPVVEPPESNRGDDVPMPE